MQIPRELPQFTEHNTCIAVFGGKSLGIFYVAHAGTLNKVAEIREEKLVYSDREGFFLLRGGGETYGSGSVYEDKSDYLAERFAKNAATELAKVVDEHDLEAIYMFEPVYSERILARQLSPTVREKVIRIIPGNFTKVHPLKLVVEIQKAEGPPS